jgi:hypothetical protein
MDSNQEFVGNRCPLCQKIVVGQERLTAIRPNGKRIFIRLLAHHEDRTIEPPEHTRGLRMEGCFILEG